MKTPIDYFYQNSPKAWDVTEALIHYDGVGEFKSFVDLVECLQQDLFTVEKRQPLFRRYVNTILGVVKNVKNMKCLQPTRQRRQKQSVHDSEASTHKEAEQHQTQNDREKEREPQYATLNFERLADSFTNNGEFNLVKNNVPQKRESLCDAPNDQSSSTTTSQPPPLVLTEGSINYMFDPPCSPLDQPHKPKLRKIQLGELEQLLHFGTEYCQTDNVCAKEYNDYQRDQSQNSSLAGLGLLDELARLLDETHYDEFLDEVWGMKPNKNMSSEGKMFLDTVKHVLSSFHLVHRSAPMFMLNHERTSFCENIIPGLLALSKMIGFLEFRWCEVPFHAAKSNSLKERDYDGRSTPAAKNIDALGVLKTQNNMELVTVEASSGILKEHTTHSIEDSLKILECSVASLRREATNFKFSSLETFKRLNTYGIQIIKSKITLSKTNMYNKNTWKHVEMRTAQIPITWHNRITLIEYLELLATLFNELLYTQAIQDQLLKERVNIRKRKGDLVGSILTLP